MNYRPYRLINDAEIRAIQQNFDRILCDWNHAYALHPLSCCVSRTSKDLCSPLPDGRGSDYLLVGDVALLVAPDWDVINDCLFGDRSNCFTTQSKTLFLMLLNDLLGTQSLDAIPVTPPINNWFYTGSPALMLTINQTMTIYLHPTWVLSRLPLPESAHNPLVKIGDAVATENVRLYVELNPVPLKLTDMVHLKIGDVIKTDHPITTPLRLSLNQKAICSVEIGQDNSHKSIQITRTQ